MIVRSAVKRSARVSCCIDLHSSLQIFFGVLALGLNSSPAGLQVLKAVSALGNSNRMRCCLASRGFPRITIRSSRTRFAPSALAGKFGMMLGIAQRGSA